MKRLYSLLVIFCMLFGISGSLQAQLPDVTVDLSLINPEAIIFTAGDLDLTNSGDIPPFFNLTVTSNTESTLRIKLELRVLANGVQIVRGESNEIDLPPGIVIVTNSQLLSMGVPLVNGQTLELDIDDNDIDYNAVDNLEEAILNTGFLPAGQYDFLMSAILVSDGSVIGDDNPDHTLFISNPTSIEQQFPGRSVSESIIEEINTIFPYFQWYADAVPGSVTFNFYVYEKQPEDFNIQDVLSHQPILHIQNYQNSFIQYPTDTNPVLSSGQVVGPVRLLENGKTYYWQVESVIPTATNNIVLQSDIFRFKVADDVQGINYSPQIVTFLRQILGPDYEGALQSLLENGFEPNGTITMDGSTVEINQLLLLISQFQSGKLKLKKVEVY
ncbi:MAG: hypothetical protein R3C41_13845 [Calditrichia bacterium]|nr:hypothetical protein [Calditrichia bacterium]